jgi:phospholipid transport system transporter-binding protein
VSAELRIEGAGPDGVRLRGPLGFAQAASALARSGEVVAGARERTVDLGGLETVDSATLAVLLAWSARALAAGGRLRYVGVPAGLRALAHLCDGEALLGMEPAGAGEGASLRASG